MTTRLIKDSARTLALALLVTSIAACKSRPNTTDEFAELNRNRAEARQLADRAHAEHRKGNLQDAERLYLEAINLDGGLAAAWNNLGELRLRQGIYADAIAAFTTASQLAPAFVMPEYNLGVTYQKLGWARDALEHYTNALSRESNYLPALRGAVKAAADLGITDQATHDRIRAGLLSERDEEWRTYFEQQRYRVEAGLRNAD